MMDRRRFLAAGLALPVGACAAVQQSVGGSIASGDYSVRDFGAQGDGKTNDTAAVQAAIDQCAKTGGSVVFPPGEFRTGMIRLKSHVTIELRNQAVWRAIPDVSLYPKVVEGLPPAFLFAEDEEDLHITGQGKIHGSGDAHEAFIPGREQVKGPRPFGLLLRRCRNLSLSGITLESSAYWMLRPEDCDDVVISGVKVLNHANFNNDGFDICDCHRVVISDCILDCEDDAICLKSHSARGVEDIVVNNCIVSSHASAIKFGTASHGAFNRIAVSNCVVRPSSFRETLHPIQMINGITGIDLASTDGAALTNVSFNNIVIDGPLTAFFLRLGNRHSRRKPEPGASGNLGRAGMVEGVSLSNIQAVNVGPVACSISGYPDHYVRDVRLSNIALAFRVAGTAADLAAIVPENSHQYPLTRMFGVNLPTYGLYLRHVKDIAIDGLHLRPMADEPRPELVADDVHGLEVGRLTTSHPKRVRPWLKTSNSTHVHVDGEVEREG
jgi:polygalacturonase